MPASPFNPCGNENEDENIPAKIWELLRRNAAFRAAVQKLRKLDEQERSNWEKTGKYHGASWNRSWRLVRDIEAKHPFAGVALQWLVPEPLFHCHLATWPRGKHWKARPVFGIRFLRVGEGRTPNINDSIWVWRNPAKPDIAGHAITRGPDVYWTKSRFERLRSKVNPLLEWRRYNWPFTVEHSWRDAPPQFRREFEFLWRSRYDCRPKNPITGTRSDSPEPHETDFFENRRRKDSRASGAGGSSKDDLVKFIRSKELADDYRVFAVPRQLLTRQAAKSAFEHLYKQVAVGLSDERQLFGTRGQWRDFLAVECFRSDSEATRKHAIQSHLREGYGSKSAPFRKACQTYETDVTGRVAYIERLRDLIFPGFPLAKLLVPMLHRRATRHSKK
jgi:hypothetical protein